MSISDKLIGLKYIGYCRAHMPPDEAEFEFKDFIEYAKFQLCVHSKTLMNDPIWESYTAEEIIAEYYGVLYTKSKEHRAKFESLMLGDGTTVNSFADWADKQSVQNKKELKTLEQDLDESISFSPKSIGE